jgi:multiple sugar transport system permease protein
MLPVSLSSREQGTPRMTTVTTGQPAAARPATKVRTGIFNQAWISRADYLYVLPAIVVMLIVIAYPIYYTIDLSFFKTPPGLQLKDKEFIGLDNYTAILTSDVFWRVTLNTIIWTLASTVFSFILGFGSALALHRDFIGRGVLRAILIIPWVISAVAASYIWKWIYHSEFGVIGAVLMQLGFVSRPPNFIDSVSTVLPSLIVVNIWREFPFAMIMLMAGLQTVPDQLLRAAKVDGASAWQRFWHVTFPHLRGVSTVTVLLLAVANFNSFIIPWIMTGGGPSNASHIWITHIYELAFGRQRWGVAAAYSVLLFIILMTFGYFYVRALSRGEKGADA